MPALYFLGVRDALAEVQAGLEPSELLLACLDDVCIVARPDRVRFLFDRLSETLWRTACIRMVLAGSPALVVGEVPVFVGSLALAPAQRVLGVPVGSPQFVAAQLLAAFAVLLHSSVQPCPAFAPT